MTLAFGPRSAALLRRTSFLGPLAMMLLACAILWPAPGGVVLSGAVLGLVTSLLAVGLALVYRANRIVNFAQAELGAAPASLAVLLILSRGWSFYPAVACGLVAALASGALVELLFVRRFFRAPRLILTVATIGIAQLLVALGIFLPRWIGVPRATRYSPPIDVTFEFGGTIFSGNDVLPMLVVPAVLLALAVFMRFSTFGIALRASAESADRAALLGVPVQRLHTLIWALASALAFVALFLRAGIVGMSIGRVLESTVLLVALAAAVIGRMERLPTIVASSVGLGIVSQSVKAAWDADPKRDAVLAVIIALALLASRSRALARVGEGVVSTWQATREVRPVPHELRGLLEVRLAKVAAGVVVATAALLPLLLPVSRLRLAGVVVVFGILGTSLVVLTGWGGQVSLGQTAVMGLAGATGAAVTSRLHMDLAIGLLAGGLAGLVIMVLIGLPALRVRGLAFAVITLALALVTSSFLLNPTYFGEWLPEGRIGRPEIFGTIPTATERQFYLLSLVVLLAVLYCARALRSGRTGRVLIASRENETSAQSYGISPRRAALTAFAVSGFIAGLAGTLFIHQQQAIDRSNFTAQVSLQVFSMVVVGGLGSLSGAVVGAVYLRSVEYFLPSEWSFLATGAGLLLVLILLPGGLGAALGDLRDAGLRRLARRRGIRVPSLVADTRVDFTASPAMRDAVAEGIEEPLVEELHP